MPQTPQGQPSPLGGFEVALRHLDAEILASRYRNGTRLPPERELAAQLGVGRGAVREAIRVLQAQGILVSATGPGNGTRVQAQHVEAIGRILQLHLALESVSFGDVSETRAALEGAAMSSAARVRRTEPLATAAHLQKQMKTLQATDRQADPEAFNDLDTRFHVALAQAGDNQLLSDLAVAIRRSVHTPILDAEHSLADWRGFQERLVAQHDEMLRAVQSGDEQAAAASVQEHIRYSYRALLATSTARPEPEPQSDLSR